MERTIDRLNDFANHLMLHGEVSSIRDFENRCRLGNMYLKKGLIGKGNVGSDVIYRIWRTFPYINIDWLITGRGTMMIKPKKVRFEVRNEEITAN